MRITRSAGKATEMADVPKIRLGIIFGGRSGEHEVSVASAASVIEALDPNEFEITAIGIKKTGELATASEVLKMLPASVEGRVVPRGFLESRESRLRLTPAPGTKQRADTRRRRLFSLYCTAPTEKTARFRDCSKSRACRISAAECWLRPWGWTRIS